MWQLPIGAALLLAVASTAFAADSAAATTAAVNGAMPLWFWIAIAAAVIVIAVFAILYRAGGGIATDARLIVDNPDSREYAIVGRTTRIGAADDNDLVIDIERVSRHHCVILHRKQEFVLKDLNALEGTLLNDEPIDGEAVLADGDRIGLGKRAGIAFRSD